MPRLSKTVVDQFTATRDTTLGDTLLPGFGIRIRPPNPQKIFYVQYRLQDGTQRRRKLGVYGVLTVEEAREMARQWLSQVALGHDPAAEPHARVVTLADLAQRYLTHHATPKKKASSQRHDRTILRVHVLPALGERRVEQVTRAEVALLHQALADRPTQANRVLALLSTMLRLAEQWGLRPVGSNPVLGIPRYREHARERYLTPQELTRLFAVLGEAERTQAVSPVGLAALRVLLMTGARVGEILTLEWRMIDWEVGRARLPESKTGAKTLYLAPEALDVLRRLPRLVGCPWCFPSQQAGKHFVALPRLWARMRREAGLEDVRLHDLRHTFAAAAAASGESLATIGAMLGHQSVQTTRRYAHLLPEIVDQAARRTVRRLLGGREELHRK